LVVAAAVEVVAGFAAEFVDVDPVVVGVVVDPLAAIAVESLGGL